MAAVVLRILFNENPTEIVCYLNSVQIVTLSDFENGFVNAERCCARLNKWVNTRMMGHAFQSLLMLLHARWYLLLLNLVMLAWLLDQIYAVQPGQPGVYDPREMEDYHKLVKHLKDAVICLAFYVLTFFIYAYQ